MAFAIGFEDAPLEHPYDDASIPAARGRIVLGDWAEEFLANLGEWTPEEYRNQWRRSIQSLLEGQRKAVLITTFSSPKIASHIEWWALYRVGEEVFAQNQLLFFEDIGGKFDTNRAVEYLRERRTENNEGVSISEWNVSVSDLEAFASEGKH